MKQSNFRFLILTLVISLVSGCDQNLSLQRSSWSKLDQLIKSPPANMTEDEVANAISKFFPRMQRSSKMRHYESVHHEAADLLPSAVEMERKYIATDHFITHFGFEHERTTIWNTESFFGGRYTLTMQVEIVVDYAKETFTVVGPEKFFLNEITSVARDGHAPNGKSLSFGEESFRELIMSNWDYTTVGLQIKTNPIVNWVIYQSMCRAPRYPITLKSKVPDVN